MSETRKLHVGSIFNFALYPLHELLNAKKSFALYSNYKKLILPGYFECSQQSDTPQHRHSQRWHDFLIDQNKLENGTDHNNEIKSETEFHIINFNYINAKNYLLNKETM